MQEGGRINYSRDLLLSLRLAVVSHSQPCFEVCQRLDGLDIGAAYRLQRRGCRAGQRKQQQLFKVRYTHCAVGQIPIVSTCRLSAAAAKLQPRSVVSGNNRVPIRPARHATPTAHRLTFGAMNVHSANDKIDSLLSLRQERNIDVLLLCETWHDSDSVSIRRLRADGMQVIERARPRVNHDNVD